MRDSGDGDCCSNVKKITLKYSVNVNNAKTIIVYELGFRKISSCTVSRFLISNKIGKKVSVSFLERFQAKKSHASDASLFHLWSNKSTSLPD